MYPLHIVSAEEYGHSHSMYSQRFASNYAALITVLELHPSFNVAQILGPDANLSHQNSSPSPYPRICIPFP